MPSVVEFAIKWDQVGQRFYETGTSRGVLYVAKDVVTTPTDPYNAGVAWNGLTAVTAAGNGGEPSPIWADDIKYLNLISAEEATVTIEAYTYPDEFMECDGSRSIADGVVIGQQPRKQFGFSYRTIIGNDTKANDYGYKIHLVYGCYAAPSDRSYATVNDSPEAISFSWEVSTTPVELAGYKPTATLDIDSTKCDPTKLAAFEEILYGKAAVEASGGQQAQDAVPARLPLPAEVITLLG